MFSNFFIQRAALACFALSCIASCSHRSLDFSIISTKRIDLSSGEKFVKMNRKVSAVDSGKIIIIFPTNYPSFQKAVDNAIAQAPGAVAIVDGTIHERFWWIPYIYGKHEIKVVGVPVAYKGHNSKIANPATIQKPSNYKPETYTNPYRPANSALKSSALPPVNKSPNPTNQSDNYSDFRPESGDNNKGNKPSPTRPNIPVPSYSDPMLERRNNPNSAYQAPKTNGSENNGANNPNYRKPAREINKGNSSPTYLD